MTCGGAPRTSTAPAIRFASAKWAALPWREFVRTAWTRARRFVERRNQRFELGELNDRLLADIGVSRADALAEEPREAFWRSHSGGLI